MFTGGVSFTAGSDRAIRLIALLGTPIFAGYNIAVMFGVAPSTHFTGVIPCVIISMLWVIVGAYHYMNKIRSKYDMAVRVIAYQILTLATLVFITGFATPFAPSVTLLFLAANIYFGRRALAASIISLIVVAVIDTIVRLPSQPYIAADNAIGVVGILVLGIALVGVVEGQETRRQALLHSQDLERLQYDRIMTIINNLSDAAFSTNEKGEIVLYNAACLDLLDTNDNLKGKNIGSIFKLVDTESKSVNLFNILSDSQKAHRRDDLRHTYEDGESIRLELSLAPIRSTYSVRKKGQVQGGYIVIARDVTKQKSLEEERDEFISVVSHELRTPITIVEGTLSNLDVLINQPKTPNQKVLAGSIKTAHDKVLYLAKMVNDLSTLSRAERGVADAAEDIGVTELLHAMHHQYATEAEKKGLHLNLDLGTKLGAVHASRLYLEELLQNFVTNAIKYTESGEVTIIAKRTKQEIYFAVKDTGLGISRADQIKVFNKFYRSEDYRIRETSGTGLGLYVSAKLAQKLGTQINLKSRLNHGSEFSFELPAQQ